MAINKDVKNRVIELKKASLPVVAIAKELDISRPTVQRILIDSANNKEDLDLNFIRPIASEVISILALYNHNIFKVRKIQDYCDDMYKICTETNNIEDSSIF